MNSAGYVGGGVRRNNGEPSVGAAALWTSILWKRMEKLMDEMYNGCVKVILRSVIAMSLSALVLVS
jgi:hypothetical protein